MLEGHKVPVGLVENQCKTAEAEYGPFALVRLQLKCSSKTCRLRLLFVLAVVGGEFSGLCW